MERPTKAGSGARRRLVVPRPVNEKQLSAFLSSKGGQHEFVRRLAETLRQAWCRIAELEGEPPKENLQEERDWQTCERVLVVSEADGTVEIFGEPWIALKHLEVAPWQDRDDEVWNLGAEWRRLDESPKSKVLIVPQIRSELTDRALVELMKWERRAYVLNELTELLRDK
jgi:hypothetical protein